MENEKRTKHHGVDLNPAPYQNGKELIEKLGRVIERVENGECESSACLAEDVNKSWFRRFIRSDISIKPDSRRKFPALTEDDWMFWEDVLMRDICDEEVYFADGLADRLSRVMENGFTNTEKAVILMKYRDNLSCEVIGTQFGVTRERIRQIGNKAIRKLRHPKNRNYLLYGDDYAKAMQKLKTMQAEYDLAVIRKFDAMKKRYADELRSKLEVIEKDKAELEKSMAELNEKQKILMETPIESLELSVRSYNILRIKLRIRSVGQLILTSREQLKAARGMGRKSLNEITEKVYRMTGIAL